MIAARGKNLFTAPGHITADTDGEYEVGRSEVITTDNDFVTTDVEEESGDEVTQIEDAKKKMLLEQHLNAARAAYCCSSSNLQVEQHLNAARAAKFLLEQQYAARAAFIFRISH
ncbi:hypothetical protein DPMN_115282 [Dreissena polymorpha]|uniref:Uncharacterized protein n=1 Tax=Dreissena polymorpha TaxID=45954 RepID=A0A9D4QT81_DREPO|nr:hypothetical protein DPMN_115282 [Dreissena polymorpha]